MSLEHSSRECEALQSIGTYLYTSRLPSGIVLVLKYVHTCIGLVLIIACCSKLSVCLCRQCYSRSGQGDSERI